MHILVIPSWYPLEESSINGIFIKKHIHEIARKNRVTVLYFEVNSTSTNPGIAIRQDGQIEEIIVYCGSYGLIRKLLYINWQFFKIVYLGSKLKYNLIHVHVIYHIGIFLSFFLMISRIPIVISEHWTGYFEEDGAFKRLGSLHKFIMRLLFAKALRITAISNLLKTQLDKLFSTGEKSKVVHNILNCEITPRDSDKLNQNMFVFLVVTNFDNRQKGLTGIIKALYELESVNMTIKGVFVGNGKDFEFIKKYAAGMRRSGLILEFPGRIDNKQLGQFYNDAHIYVLNSYFETFSISAAEALLYGIPVISTRCNGPEEFVNESNGILVPTGDHKALVNAMKCMITNFNTYDSKKISQDMRDKYCSFKADEFYN